VKTTLAFFLVTLYTLAACKPVLPLIQDEIAHLFWKARHLATVHHHHGDHHAKHAITEAKHEEGNSKAPSTSKTSEPVSIHIIIHNAQAVFQLVIDKQNYATRTYGASTLTIAKYYPPPKVG
jgi:hypothetical protein